MQFQPDLLISDRFGAPAAIVMVKALKGATAETATRYLRNLLAHGVVPTARYVLLVTPGTGYLWSKPEAIMLEADPSLVFPMDRIVQHYLPANGDQTVLRDLVLASIVKQWLADLADGIPVDDRVTELLQESGFLRAVREGLVNTQAPA